MAKQEARIVVVGAGGHGTEVLAYINDLRAAGAAVSCAGFLDDGRPAGEWLGTRVLGPIDLVHEAQGHQANHFITALGNNETRLRVVNRVERSPGALPAFTLVHYSALVGPAVTIGSGTLLAPRVLLTAQVTVGRHCILNVNASISHDCVVGDFVNINPGATLCGRVRVGDGAFIGAGAVVKENVAIGRGAVLGAGAVVVSDVADGAVVVGVPARTIKTGPIGWLG